MADWYTEAEAKAAQHPTVLALRSRSQWFRKCADDFLNNSVASMRQHECDAQALEETAKKVEMELIARAGVDAGEYRSYAVGFNHEIGSYISIETSQGWDPEPFWCQSPTVPSLCL